MRMSQVEEEGTAFCHRCISLQVRSLLALLVQKYKYCPLRSCISLYRYAFTCFTSTKMQILPCAVDLLYYAKVQILTPEEMYLSAAVAVLFWPSVAPLVLDLHPYKY